jgi:hypothetical protein
MNEPPERLGEPLVVEGVAEIPWSVRATTVLLLTQVGLFAGLAALTLWQTAVTTWDALWEGFLEGDPPLFFSVALLLLTLLTGWALPHFYRLHLRGWFYAMLVQCFCLLLGLVAYFISRSVSAQIMLLSGIFMTTYLHNPETKAAFHVKDGLEEAD